MPDLVHWSAFFAATAILLLIPGPSVMYVVTRSLENGYRGVIFSSLGLALGDLLQVFCTVLGLSAVLASSTAVFSIVKYAGSAYLITLGLQSLTKKRAASVLAPTRNAQHSSRYLVTQAFWALNPKTAIFFLAFFPQFIASGAGPAWFQILLFGCAFVLLGLVTNSMYGFLGGTLKAIGKQSSRFQAATGYLSSLVLIGMGIAAALAPAPHKPM